MTIGRKTQLVGGVVLAAALGVLLIQIGGDPTLNEPGLSQAETPSSGSASQPPLEGAEPARIAVETPELSPGEEQLEARIEQTVREQPDPPPPGCLRVIARRADVPLAHRPVTITRSDEDWLPRNSASVDTVTSRWTLDADGELSACSLEPGTYFVSLEIAADQVPTRRVKLLPGEGRTVLFELSDASLSGVVYDAQGVPVSAARVGVTGTSESGLSWTVWTDEQGAYLVEALAAGTYWVVVNHDGSPYSESEHMLRVPLSEGEAKHLDFGAPTGLVTWTGVLRSRTGSPVLGVAGSPARIHAIRFEDRDYSNAEVGDDGRFSMQLAPGLYRVAVSPSGRSQRVAVVESLEVGAVPFERDLVLPGTRVRGRVLNLGADRPGGTDRGERRLTVRAHLDGELFPSAFHVASVAADGSYALDGLGPGLWRIGPDVSPLEGYVEVLIAADSLELDVDLKLPR